MLQLLDDLKVSLMEFDEVKRSIRTIHEVLMQARKLWTQQRSPKRWRPATSLQGVSTQRTQETEVLREVNGQLHVQAA